MKFSLVVLCKNEIEGLKLIGPRIPRNMLHEVIVIDGGSNDGSQDFAKSLGFTVVQQFSKGITGGLYEGFRAATGDAIIGFTPDNNMIPEKIPAIIEKMREGYDMVICSRYFEGAKSEDDTFLSGFGNWMYTAMVNALFGSRYTDVLGFYRAFRRDLLQELAIKPELTIDTTLCIRAHTYGKRVIEIGGDEPPRFGGRSSTTIVGNGMKELYTILREYFYFLTGIRSANQDWFR